MSETSQLERLLRRDRAVTLVGLLILCALAWLYMASGAGLGAGAPEVAAPTSHPAAMPGMPAMATASPLAAQWAPSKWALMIAMWWVMMVAMMTPSAAPAILLYARAYRHAISRGQVQDRLAPTGAFAAGYLLVWLAFSAVAATSQWLLERVGLASAMTTGLQSRWFSAAVLIAAGAYQLSPLKSVCLAHCRAPASFLSRFWRPGAAGALRLGAIHGVYCVGCCWLLMALLFVVGVMNLVWIAALAGLVLVEKVVPRGEWIARAAGVGLIGWGAVTLAI